MTELQKTGESPTATAHIRTTTDASEGSTAAVGHGISSIRRLVLINLGLVALEPISAGLFLSGYERAVTIHGVVALALQLGALIQTVTAIVLWRRHRVPAWMAGFSIGLLVMVFFQVGLGYKKQYWLHVPIGVGLFGGLIRQVSRLDTFERTIGARS